MSEKQTIMKTLENQRAEFALLCVKNIVAAYSKEEKEKYKGNVKKIPMLIKTNGLGNTLAFMRSRKEHKLIYDHLSNWLRKPENPCKTLPEGKDLLEFVISESSPVYRHVTKELIALLTWMKRFADSLIEGEAHD